MTGIGTASLPIDQAQLPSNLRGASAERREHYQAALSFERVLVGQLTEQLMKSSSSDEDAPAAVKVMKQNLPSTLADAVMGAGGMGLAQQFDAAWHPESQVKSTSLSDLSTAADAPAATNVVTGSEGGASA